MPKTYLIMYKNGKTKTVKGNLVFFSSVNTEVPRPPDAIYLNADEVMSVVEQNTDSQKEG